MPMEPHHADQQPDPGAIRRAAALLRHAQYIAVLIGAGASAESGIATFRDALTGQWTKFDPQQLASPTGFQRDPGLVWRWYMERLETLQTTSPNPGHYALAKLARRVPRLTLITQNVDDLHERAGSKQPIHLHGNIASFRCHTCATPYKLRPEDRRAQMPPTCPHCGGYIRPDVVWFEELLPADALDQAEVAARACDVLIVVGTSGIVFPAAQLPWAAQAAGAQLIDINPDETPYTTQAAVSLRGPSGIVLPVLVEALDAPDHNTGR